MSKSSCPCGSGRDYQQCCGPYIEGKSLPETAEQLMRSRYTAYTLAKVEYIADTMRGEAAKHFDAKSAKSWAESVSWLGLVVRDHQSEADRATVSFIASCKVGDRRENIIEKSEFQKIDGRWYYLDGEQPKIGRNDFCPCGSGKKYKKCCML